MAIQDDCRLNAGSPTKDAAASHQRSVHDEPGQDIHSSEHDTFGKTPEVHGDQEASFDSETVSLLSLDDDDDDIMEEFVGITDSPQNTAAGETFTSISHETDE